MTISQHRGHVLIVEDNSINQKVLSNLLARLNLTSDITDNGEKALQRLHAERTRYYDLIFMDCQMPVMDGFEATRHIRASKLPEAEIPIIAATAQVMSGDAELCLQAGMNACLSKPISGAALRVVLDQWLPE